MRQQTTVEGTEWIWPDVLAHAVGGGVGLGPHESNPMRASTPPAAWAASGRRPRWAHVRGLALHALRTNRTNGCVRRRAWSGGQVHPAPTLAKMPQLHTATASAGGVGSKPRVAEPGATALLES